VSIVDFHMHFFARPFFDALATQSPLDGSPGDKLAALSHETGIELPSADTGEHLSRWLGELDRNGVEHAAAFASLPQEIPAVAEAAAASDGRLSPFALVNPKVEGAPQRVRGLIEESGFKGVILFPAMHHYHPGGPGAAELLGVLEEYGAIAFVHCGLLIVKLRDLLGLPRTQDLAFANPLGLIPAANAHPNVKFVIPHFGAGFFRETLMAGTMCENVYVDTSSSNSWMETQVEEIGMRDVFRATIDTFGVERILFGTDSGVFPAGWRKDRYEGQHEALGLLGTSGPDMEAIFSGNAKRLLGL
jgi:predicted TIM-barrel fold metal-dependent hydrolase